MKHSILLTSLLVLSGSLAACSSGGGSDGGNDAGSGGTTAGTGGGGVANIGGGGGGNPGVSGGGSGGAPVHFCDAPNTIFKVDVDTANPKTAGCTGAACHTTANAGAFPPDLEAALPESRLVNVVSTSFFCTGDTYIDTTNVDDSLILRVIEPNPMCEQLQGGTIEQMPFGSTTDHSVPALTSEQKQCIIDWVHYIVANQP